ncbi:unnamed protein product [Malus baccata var. baccata]
MTGLASANLPKESILVHLLALSVMGFVVIAHGRLPEVSTVQTQMRPLHSTFLGIPLSIAETTRWFTRSFTALSPCIPATVLLMLVSFLIFSVKTVVFDKTGLGQLGNP